ncbi:hypothetical protein M3Y99_01751000 [Aphelenchoides fujianensis]|nr:hypothetical protein M3Y99_01751000 [Aphelenchoides fujianensis]
MTFGVLVALLAVGLNGALGDVVSQPVGYAANFLTTSLFLPEASMSVNLTEELCRERYRISSNVYTADGQYAEDVLTLGGQEFDGFVRFCDLQTDRSQAQSTSDDPVNWFMKLPIDGFFGLKPGGENAFQRMLPKGRQLTVWIDQKSTEPDNAGVITFGGKDESHCKTYKTFPSEDSDRFSAWISKATFNSNTYKNTYSGVFSLQNGTLLVPYEIYSDVYSYFGGQLTYFYCSNYQNPPDLKVTIYGKEYTISLKSLISPYSSSSSSYCSIDLSYSDTDAEDQFVLNRAILNNYCLYLDYDNSIVGLAERK